jgi:hypothetical protein
MVLKTVNSPYYNLSNKVSDLQHAVVLLGFDQVHQLVMSGGVLTTMPNSPQFKELQLHANAVSFICMEVARLTGLEKPSSLATLGLMHDVGMSVLMLLKQQFPNLYSFIDMLDAAKVGGMLLERWELPDAFCQVVVHQNHPGYLPPDALEESLREPLAGLFLSHLCYDYLRGVNEAALPSAHLEAWMEVVGQGGVDLPRFVASRLLPAVEARKATYPDSMRRFFGEAASRLKGR